MVRSREAASRTTRPQISEGMEWPLKNQITLPNLPLPHGPDIFQFSTWDKMRNALTEIGFAQVDAIQFPQEWQVKSGQQMLAAVYEGTVRTRALLAAQTIAVIAKIVAALDEAIAGMRSAEGGFDVPAPAVIGSGAKT